MDLLGLPNLFKWLFLLCCLLLWLLLVFFAEIRYAVGVPDPKSCALEAIEIKVYCCV